MRARDILYMIYVKNSNFNLYDLCKKALEEVGSTKENKDIKNDIYCN